MEVTCGKRTGCGVNGFQNSKSDTMVGMREGGRSCRHKVRGCGWDRATRGLWSPERISNFKCDEKLQEDFEQGRDLT